VFAEFEFALKNVGADNGYSLASNALVTHFVSLLMQFMIERAHFTISTITPLALRFHFNFHAAIAG
jgi:hypothetical protein